MFIGASSEFGEADIFLILGEGVDIGEPVFEYCSPSDLCLPFRTLPPRVAKAAAVAATDSAIVPVW